MERSFDEPASPYLTRKIGVNHTNQKFFLKTRADGQKDDMILNIDSMNMAD